ncbi:MAG: hypothetical protein GSR78_04815 [Desulfurococcales archaeon]|nr:hypothetical protein [Desulfurococcales archaeon]
MVALVDVLRFYYTVARQVLRDLGECGAVGSDAVDVLREYVEAARDYVELGLPVRGGFVDEFRGIVDKSFYLALRCRGIDPVETVRAARRLEARLAVLVDSCSAAPLLLAELRESLYRGSLVDVQRVVEEARRLCPEAESPSHP